MEHLQLNTAAPQHQRGAGTAALFYRAAFFRGGDHADRLCLSACRTAAFCGRKDLIYGIF